MIGGGEHHQHAMTVRLRALDEPPAHCPWWDPRGENAGLSRNYGSSSPQRKFSPNRGIDLDDKSKATAKPKALGKFIGPIVSIRLRGDSFSSERQRSMVSRRATASRKSSFVRRRANVRGVALPQGAPAPPGGRRPPLRNLKGFGYSNYLRRARNQRHVLTLREMPHLALDLGLPSARLPKNHPVETHGGVSTELRRGRAIGAYFDGRSATPAFPGTPDIPAGRL